MYIEDLNNCSEVISLLIEAYHTVPAIIGTVLFQGDERYIDGRIPNPTSDKIIIPHKSNKYKFILEDSLSGELAVFIYNIDINYYGKTASIILPKYIKEELIATIKGEW